MAFNIGLKLRCPCASRFGTGQTWTPEQEVPNKQKKISQNHTHSTVGLEYCFKSISHPGTDGYLPASMVQNFTWGSARWTRGKWLWKMNVMNRVRVGAGVGKSPFLRCNWLWSVWCAVCGTVNDKFCIQSDWLQFIGEWFWRGEWGAPVDWRLVALSSQMIRWRIEKWFPDHKRELISVYWMSVWLGFVLWRWCMMG